jgi:anti-anti-sigma regulatory factor
MPVMNVILGDFNYTLGVGQGNTFLKLAGNLCGSNAARLSTVFQRAMLHVSGKFFLSLQGCKEMDEQILALLIQQQVAMGEKCRDLVLVDVPSQILKILETTSFTTLCEILPSLREAENKYGHVVS